MKLQLLSTLLLSFIIINTSAQKDSAEVLPKNQIDVFYHTNHFFDNSKTLWLDLKPFSLGIQYTRRLKNKHHLRFSVLHFVYNYYRSRDYFILGDVFRRYYVTHSVGYIYNVLQLKFFEIDVLGEYNLRTGNETIHLYNPHSWEAQLYDFTLMDSGLTLGTRLGFNLKNFMITLEAKYTSFIIRPDKTVFPDETHVHRSSQNTATFKFGLGYRF